MQFEINSKIDFFLLNKETLKGERKEGGRKDRQTKFSSESHNNTQKAGAQDSNYSPEKYERKMGENCDCMNNT